MNYLTNYYKNLCEKLENEINLIQEQLHSSIDNPKKSDLGTLVSGKGKGMQPESSKSSEEVKPTYPEEEKGDELQEGKRSKKGTNRLGPEAESTASFQLQHGERGRFPTGLTKRGEHPLAKILLIASQPKKFSGKEQQFATDALQAIQQKLKDKD